MPQGATLFQVHFLDQTASYRVGGKKVVVYLKDYQDTSPEAQREVTRSVQRAEMIISKEIYHGSIRGQVFRPEEKGSASGVRALTINPPLAYQGEDQELVDEVAGDRIQRMKKLVNGRREDLARNIAELDQHIEALEGPLTLNAEMLATYEEAKRKGLPVEQNQAIPFLLKTKERCEQLKQQRDQLLELKAKWDGVNLPALCMALAYLPAEITEESVMEAAGKVALLVLQQNPGSRDYAVDVGGLLFSALPEAASRKSYLAYCRKMGIQMRQDCLEDHLIATVVQQSSTQRPLLAEMDVKHRELDRKDTRSEEERAVAQQLIKLEQMRAAVGGEIAAAMVLSDQDKQAREEEGQKRLEAIKGLQSECQHQLFHPEKIEDGFISWMNQKIEQLGEEGAISSEDDEEVVVE